MNMKKTIKYRTTLLAAALGAHCLFVSSATVRRGAIFSVTLGR